MRVEVCKTSDIPQGESRLLQAGDDAVLMFHLADGFFATQPRCTHMFVPLKRGKVLKDKCIECPLHRARFDIRTGEVVDWANFPPGIQLLNVVRAEKPLKTWPVEVEGDQVFVVLDPA